jgi:hypothetical protein
MVRRVPRPIEHHRRLPLRQVTACLSAVATKRPHTTLRSSSRKEFPKTHKLEVRMDFSKRLVEKIDLVERGIVSLDQGSKVWSDDRT